MKTFFFDEVENTQELARNKFNGDSLLVIAKSQSQGRGRKGSEWENADQSLACSLAFTREKNGVEESLLPLIASYLFTCLYEDREINLKWPNDLIFGEKKVGGVMIEKFGDTYVAGLGVNYYWRSPSVLSAPTFLIGTSYLLAMPRKYATYISDVLPINVSPLPIDVPNYQVKLYWHKTRDKDKKINWIIDKLSDS